MLTDVTPLECAPSCLATSALAAPGPLSVRASGVVKSAGTQVRLRGCGAFVVVDVDREKEDGDVVEEKEEAKEAEVTVPMHTLRSGPVPSLLGLTTFKAEPIVIIQQFEEAVEGDDGGVVLDAGEDEHEGEQETEAEEKAEEKVDGGEEQEQEAAKEGEGKEGEDEQKEPEAEEEKPKPTGSWENQEIFVDVSCNGSDFTSVETCSIIVYDGTLVQGQISTAFARVKGGTKVRRSLARGGCGSDNERSTPLILSRPTPDVHSRLLCKRLLSQRQHHGQDHDIKRGERRGPWDVCRRRHQDRSNAAHRVYGQ